MFIESRAVDQLKLSEIISVDVNLSVVARAKSVSYAWNLKGLSIFDCCLLQSMFHFRKSGRYTYLP